MENELIKIPKLAIQECEDFLINENYEINKFLKFNLYSFTYSIHRMQLRFLSQKINNFNFDEMKYDRLFANEIENQLKSLKSNFQKLNEEFNFGNHLIGVSTSIFKSDIDAYLEDKGFLMGSFILFCQELENEFKKVITSFKNFGQSKQKLTLPYKAYISIFKYPIQFLDEDFNRSDIFSLFQDFEDKTFDFLVPYCKMSTHIQKYMTLENAIILRKNGIQFG